MPQETTQDVFAAIAGMREKENDALLIRPRIPTPPDVLLPAMKPGAAAAFMPPPPVDTPEALAALLEAERAKMAPFLARRHAPPAPTRSAILLDNFEYRLDGTGDWQTVAIPHYGGPIGKHYAHYRRSFDAPADFDPARHSLHLCFEGVDYKAFVTLNNEPLGMHEGFFAPFEFRIDPWLNPSGPQQLEIRVENDAICHSNRSWKQDADGDKIYAATGLGWDDPYLGWNHCPPGMGIWGKVRVEVRPKLHVRSLFVRTLASMRDIEVRIELNQDHAEKVRVRLAVDIAPQNFDGAPLFQSHALDYPRPLEPGHNYLRFRLPLPEGVRLWSPDTPWLYHLRLHAAAEGSAVFDQVSQNFGLRTFEIREDSEPKGKIFLNGREIRLRGANTMGFEQQAALRGDEARLIDDFLLARLCGMNFLRFTQRPVQEVIYQICDALGVMVQTDLPVFGVLRRNQFCEAVRQCAEMERMIRHHPACVLVSYINEPYPATWHNQLHRHLDREELEAFFIAADRAVRLENPDRAIKPIDGDYDPPGPGLPDTHCYAAWYYWPRVTLGEIHAGHWQKVKPGWHIGCGEFGSEGLSDADLLRRSVPAEWLRLDPDYGWDPGHMGCQTGRHRHMWFEAPDGEGHAPLEAWVEASQDFQAWAVRLMTEAFRRNALMNTFAIHLFIDAWPTGWMKSIMDCERRPKKAYFAYRDALQPLLPSLRPERWHFEVGDRVRVEVWACCDLLDTAPSYRLVYQLEKDGRVMAAGETAANVVANDSTFQGKIDFPAPAVERRTDFVVRAAFLTPEGRIAGTSSQTITVFPPPPALPAARHLGPTRPEWLAPTAARDLPVLVLSGADATPERLAEAADAARTGARVILDRLPEGTHLVDGDAVTVKACAMGTRHTCARNQRHPWSAKFKPNDFRFWHHPRAGCATPHVATVLEGVEKWTPILASGNGPGSENVWRPHPVAAEKACGKGKLILCQIDLDGRLDTNPTARRFAALLLGADPETML